MPTRRNARILAGTVLLLSMQTLDSSVVPSARAEDAAPCRVLRELAMEKGDYVERRRADEGSMFVRDVATLVRQSRTIVVGVTSRTVTSTLSTDGCDITSRLGVRVTDTIKGDVLPTQTISLLDPGGKVVFSSGGSAEIRVWGRYVPIVGERTYVLFLNSLPDEEGYELSASMQGVYAIDPKTGKIEPADMRGREPLAEHCRGMKSEDFLEEIRSIVAQQAATQ